MYKLEYRRRTTLGEAPMWDEREKVLYWVDIPNGLLFRYDPATQRNDSFEIGQPIGSVALRERGGLVLAVRSGFIAFDPQSGKLERLATVEGDRPNNRFNDGKCDPHGRFWAGTMSMSAAVGAGTIYVLDSNHSVTPCLPNITIPNGFVFTENDFYYADSPRRIIYCCQLDPASGSVSQPRSALHIDKPLGVPDGMCVDVEGKVWVAHHGDGHVRRWDLKSRTLLDEIELPVKQVTACWFGGNELRTLFITTAAQGFDSADYQREPLAGSLFSIELPIGGRPAYRFKG